MLEPDSELEPEPMFGQGRRWDPDPEPDFGVLDCGAGALGVVVVGVVVVGVVVVGVLVLCAAP